RCPVPLSAEVAASPPDSPASAPCPSPAAAPRAAAEGSTALPPSGWRGTVHRLRACAAAMAATPAARHSPRPPPWRPRAAPALHCVPCRASGLLAAAEYLPAGVKQRLSGACAGGVAPAGAILARSSLLRRPPEHRHGTHRTHPRPAPHPHRGALPGDGAAPAGGAGMLARDRKSTRLNS